MCFPTPVAQQETLPHGEVTKTGTGPALQCGAGTHELS